MPDVIAPAINAYILAHSRPADDILRDLAAETAATLPEQRGMQITQDEGELLAMLARLVGAAYAVEVGVFTGYSAICVARVLPPGGKLLACDINQEWTDMARRYWERAGLTDRIELRLAPAIETLRGLSPDEPIDFAFIDADKTSYPAYYEELVRRLRPGGLIVLDNVLREGRVADPAYQEPADIVIRELNDAILRDDRVDSVMLPLRDGVTLVRKR